MPHQCLGCGFAFEEGSSALLAGCPQCKGTRFFYSAEEVSPEERERLQKQASKDLRSVVADLLQEAAPETAEELQRNADKDGWAELKPRDLRKLVKKVQGEVKRAPTEEEPVESSRRRKEVEAARERILKELAAAEDEETVPESVNIRGAGEYELDLRGLLEKDPIVVHKDGAYMIHLPSLFTGKK